VAQGLVAAIARRTNVSEADQEMYRIAALLHDVGHYPYSHAMERAVERHYQESVNIRRTDGAPSPASDGGALNHERLGSLLIAESDLEISRILEEKGNDSKQIESIISHHEDAPEFANLVSSDLDADRVDYLLRTARSRGLPYGQIDIDYLMQMVTIDDQRQMCLDSRGMRTAEHLLLARYFDYQQVTHHKTVQGYERLLEDVLDSMVSDGYLDCSEQAMREKIRNPNEWVRFDDSYVVELIRTYANENAATENEMKANALITRAGPKLVWFAEVFEETEL
jgi:uncharacterized protein